MSPTTPTPNGPPGDTPSPEELALWRRFAACARGADTPAPDLGTLAAYLEGRLDGDDLVAVESHLATSGESRGLVAEMRELLRALGDVETTRDMVELARRAMEDAHHASRRGPIIYTFVRWTAAAAAAIGISVAGYLAGTAVMGGPGTSSDEQLLSDLTFGLTNGELSETEWLALIEEASS